VKVNPDFSTLIKKTPDQISDRPYNLTFSTSIAYPGSRNNVENPFLTLQASKRRFVYPVIPLPLQPLKAIP
jgi:hypothetical protein